VIAAFKPTSTAIMVVVGITGMPETATSSPASLVPAAEEFHRGRAARSACRRTTVILKHILWLNCRALLVIQATLGIGRGESWSRRA